MPPIALPTVFTYVPHKWDYIDRFAKWYGAPFIDESHKLSNGLKTIRGHREKVRTLGELATQLVPELANEHRLLDERGYSDGAKAREFTVIVENLICELYSCLDGLRSTIRPLQE